jgi:hypothetical protein
MTIVELTDAELDYVAGGDHNEGPGCVGSIVATSNHISGEENTSAGPGKFLQGDTSEAIYEVRHDKKNKCYD